MRDIARGMCGSRSAIGSAVLRLGRQAMGSHGLLLASSALRSERLSFDGLQSVLTGADYPTQITTLGDSQTELLLAMSHCVTERGGTRTAAQAERIKLKRRLWRPSRFALTNSISLLIGELSRFLASAQLVIDTDMHPIYRSLIEDDLALQWFHSHHLLTVRTTSSRAPRTAANPLFLMNYLDRMIRHRVKEHTRETIAFGRNATLQMHRMWIFAWDHNYCQPMRVRRSVDCSRAEHAGLAGQSYSRLRREFFSRRVRLLNVPIPLSMRQVWTAALESPPVRWRVGQKHTGPLIPRYALRDLRSACPHGP